MIDKPTRLKGRKLERAGTSLPPTQWSAIDGGAFVVFAAFICATGWQSWGGVSNVLVNPHQPLVYVLLIGPVGALLLVSVLRQTALRHAQSLPRALPYWLAGVAIVLIAAPAAEAWQRPNGLWRETVIDSGFSPEPFRGYYFGRHVGLVGVAATSAAYVSLALRRQAPRRFSRCSVATAATPLIALLAIMLRQFWAPTPFFNG